MCGCFLFAQISVASSELISLRDRLTDLLAFFQDRCLASSLRLLVGSGGGGAAGVWLGLLLLGVGVRGGEELLSHWR